MADERVRILCTGDLHLGRRPSRVGAQQRALSVEYVWDRVVERAIDQSVDLVALTGDLVDRDNRFYEAAGALERGMRHLAEAGIPAFAVAGNHDFDVLPRVIDTIESDHLHLLGRGGTWQSHLLERDGDPLLRLVGWSFPKEHVDRSPLDDLDADFATEHPAAPTVYLLHADLDQKQSRYAPVASSELDDYRATAWLLGHIHRPQTHRTASEALVLYPGSPQALDPGERGVHGPWIVEVGGARRPRAHKLPLATVRYRQLTIGLDGVETPEDFERTATEQMRRDLDEITDGAGDLRRVVYRLELKGRTPLHRKLDELAERLSDRLQLDFDGGRTSVDRVLVATRPTVDLEEVARGHDPPAVLARLLLELDSGQLADENRSLVKNVRRGLDKLRQVNAFGPLRAAEAEDERPDDRTARRLLFDEGLRLLDELLAQKRGEVAQ
ncbi:MAG: metallophosphoesterase family protein [Persicimonas sp.]